MGLNAQTFLPKGFAPGELEAMPAYIQQVKTQFRKAGDPPPGPVRTIAEWEELGGVVITWTQFPSILAEIVRAAREETNVIIVCTSPSSVKSYLDGKGVDYSSNVQFITRAYNSIWVRDYGPNTGYLNNVDSLVIIDWIYNRPRYQDDVVPHGISASLNIPLYETSTAPNDLVNTGGNFMVDGLGRGFSSDLVLDENGENNTYGQTEHSEEDVDQIMNSFMGVDEYIKMEALPYDAIHHIDMHMKLLDETTLLVGEYPEGIADGPQIEANIQYVISNFEAAWDREFKVVRMPMPPDGNDRYPHQNGHYRTYTNSLIVNKSILIPTYEEKYDTTAFRIWKELMPGYNLVGINCNSIIPLSGALHCITKEVGTSDPLQISHARLTDVPAEEMDDYLVEAVIRHKSGIKDAQLYFTTDFNLDFNPIEMVLSDPAADIWSASIPVQLPLTEIQYYIAATANSGKNQVRPMPAPAGYFDFKVLDLEVQSGTDELTNKNGLSLSAVYPNPASAITAIPVSLEKRSRIKIELHDALGKVVARIFEGEQKAGDQHYFLQAQEYPSGIYWVKVFGEDFVQSEKLIIER